MERQAGKTQLREDRRGVRRPEDAQSRFAAEVSAHRDTGEAVAADILDRSDALEVRVQIERRRAPPGPDMRKRRILKIGEGLLQLLL